MFASFLRCCLSRAIISIKNPTKLGRTSIERQIHHNAPTLPLSGTLGDKVVYAESRTGLFPNVERPIDESEFNQPPQVEPSTNATGARVSTTYRAEGLVLDSALLRGTLP